jgi:hypothetical protein
LFVFIFLFNQERLYFSLDKETWWVPFYLFANFFTTA